MVSFSCTQHVPNHRVRSSSVFAELNLFPMHELIKIVGVSVPGFSLVSSVDVIS